MAAEDKNTQWTNDELEHLSNELSRYDEETIVPLSDGEVASVEETYQDFDFSAERDGRQRARLEELRTHWLADIKPLDSIIRYSEKNGLQRVELAKRLRVSLDILYELEFRVISDVPRRVCQKLADELDVDIRVIYMYFSMPPNLQQLAASSKEKPDLAQTQSWDEAIAASDMSQEDRAFWKV